MSIIDYNPKKKRKEMSRPIGEGSYAHSSSIAGPSFSVGKRSRHKSVDTMDENYDYHDIDITDAVDYVESNEGNCSQDDEPMSDEDVEGVVEEPTETICVSDDGEYYFSSVCHRQSYLGANHTNV